MTDNTYIGFPKCFDFSEQTVGYTSISQLIKNLYNIKCKNNITNIQLKTIDLNDKTDEFIVSLKKNNNITSYIKKIELYNYYIISSLFIFNILLIILIILVFKIKSKNI